MQSPDWSDKWLIVFGWWRGRDLNPRPSGYEPDELPNCSTPRTSTVAALFAGNNLCIDTAEALRWVGRVTGDEDPRFNRLAALLSGSRVLGRDH